MLAAICSVLLVALIVFGVMFAVVRDPDPVEPAVLESGHAEPRDAVRTVMERDR